MKKVFATTFITLLCLTANAVTPSEVLSQANKVNAWFMNFYKDPTIPTQVGKIRPSNLWTFAVYFEGLTALIDVAPSKRIHRLYRHMGNVPQMEHAKWSKND